MMRAIIDTNIMIRAVIRPMGTVGPIALHMRKGDYQIVYSEPIIDELKAKLALPRLQTKYSLDPKRVQDFIAEIQVSCMLVHPTEKIDVCRDVKDNMILEAAVAGKADCIVTSDQDLLVLHPFRSIKIITPREFLALFPT